MIEIKGIDPKMIANNIEPFEPTHPGELLRDEIECRHISQKQLAADMGVSYTVLNDIVNCKRPVNTKFALLCRWVSRHIFLWDCSPTMICRRPKMTNHLLHV